MPHCITENRLKTIRSKNANLKFTKEGMIPYMAHLVPILYNTIAHWI